MESWMLGPPLLIGEKVFYTKHGFILSGTVKWLGRLQEAFGNQMIAGILLVSDDTQCGKTINSLSPKKISSNQLFSNSFIKTVTFTKFLVVRENLSFFHTHSMEIARNLSHPPIFP